MFSCVGAPTSVKEVRLDVKRKRITFNPVPVFCFFGKRDHNNIS